MATSHVRSLVARRPLLAHALFGACVSAGAEAGMLHEESQDYLDAITESKTRPDFETTIKLEEDYNQWVSSRPQEIAAAAVIGGMKGAAMRYYYPALETFVDARFIGASLIRLNSIKVLLDHAPAFSSTFVLHYLSRYVYERDYELPADPDSLRGMTFALSERLQDTLRDAADAAMTLRDKAYDYSSTQRDEDSNTTTMTTKKKKKEVDTIAATIADVEQIELIDTILTSKPTWANLVTFGISVVNFTLVPRWLRGMLGTVQWMLWDDLNDILHEEVRVEVLQEDERSESASSSTGRKIDTDKEQGIGEEEEEAENWGREKEEKKEKKRG